MTGPHKTHHNASYADDFKHQYGLLEELRTRSQDEKLPMTQLVERTLRRGLSAGSALDAVYQPQVRTFQVGIKPAYQGMSMNQLYDQLESESTLKVAEE